MTPKVLEPAQRHALPCCCLHLMSCPPKAILTPALTLGPSLWN